MHLGTYEGFTDCYIDMISKVMREPQYESAPRGQNIKEILGASFTIKNPHDRIPYVVGRKFGMSYMVAELIWYLSGDNSTEWISKYSSFWKDISDDGVTANSAYGARLFKPHDKIAQGRYTQLDYIIEELRRDPDSRRAVMHLRVPDDSIDAKLDVPCTLALQFFIRDGKLHQVANMRSSDVIFGIAYDIPAFTIFQELIANELNVKVGTYTHTSNSLHIYERHFDMAEKIIKPGYVNDSLLLQQKNGPMPPLVGSISVVQDKVDEIYTFEARLQDCESLQGVIDVYNLSEVFSDSMFRDFATILTSARLRKLGYKKEARDLSAQTEFAGYSFNVRRDLNA
jgi:thymidylate synthase